MLHYFTGKGTSLDLLYAAHLNLSINELCTVNKTIKVVDNIGYYNINTLVKTSSVQSKNNYWFTSKAIKPFVT